MRYGNLADKRVYVDYFTQYNLSVSRAREAFARVANEYIKQDNTERAEELLDRGLEVLPIDQIRFTEANTYPFIEGYYNIGRFDKGDKLMMAYCNNLIEYFDYYSQFEGEKGNFVASIVDDKLNALEQAYYLAAYHNRYEVVEGINVFYRSIGATNADLILTPHEKDSLGIR